MPKRGWHKEDIKAAIRKRGVTLKQLALDNGLHPAATRDALRQPLTSAEIVIADFLGVPAADLWPERYAGSRKRRVWQSHSYLRQDREGSRRRHCQSDEAA